MSEIWEDGANPWTVESSARVRENAFFAVEANTVQAPDGKRRDYDVVRVRRVGVGMLAVESDGCVQMIGQWRFPIARYSWELPAGGAEAGEDALTCARRELEEESGLVARSWLRVLDLDISTSLTDERGVGFIAWDLERKTPHPEGREVLRRRQVHFLDVVDGVGGGHIREALSVATVLRAHQMAVTGQLPAPLARVLLERAP